MDSNCNCSEKSNYTTIHTKNISKTYLFMSDKQLNPFGLHYFLLSIHEPKLADDK